MTKSILIITSLLLSCGLHSQSTMKSKDNIETIFDGEFSVRGFLELNSEVTHINNQQAFMTGGGVTIVFNHALNIGFEGRGMISDIRSSMGDDGRWNYLNFGYGGIRIEPVFGSKNKIHVTTPILFAAGALVETDFSIWDEVNYPYEYHSQELVRSDAVFIFQPGVNAEMNIFKHLRLAAGASYRMVNDVDLPNLKNKDFEGLNANISLRFGWF